MRAVVPLLHLPEKVRRALRLPPWKGTQAPCGFSWSGVRGQWGPLPVSSLENSVACHVCHSLGTLRIYTSNRGEVSLGPEGKRGGMKLWGLSFGGERVVFSEPSLALYPERVETGAHWVLQLQGVLRCCKWKPHCFWGKQMRREGNWGQTGQELGNWWWEDLLRCLHREAQPETWKMPGVVAQCLLKGLA